MKTRLTTLFCSLLVTGAVACGPGEDPDLDERCPDERSYRCGDDSCVADAAACPDGEIDEIEGEIVSISPGTIRGAAPELVEVRLKVDDAEAVQAMLDDGAEFEISVGADISAVDELIKLEDEDADFALRFKPDTSELERVERPVSVQLSSDEGDVHSFGGAKLRYRGDLDALSIEDRESGALEGLSDPQRVWSPDLDGDGIEDLVVADVDEDAGTRLVAFRCDDGVCINHGEAMVAAVPDQIFAPDMIVDPDSDGDGVPDGDEFMVAYPSEISTGPNGEESLDEIEHLSLQLVDDGGELALDVQRSAFALPVQDGISWLANTMEPRLIESDGDGAATPGVVIMNRQQSSGETFWNQVVLYDDGEHLSRTLFVGATGLDQDGLQAMLGGQLSSCHPAGETRLERNQLPQGELISLFEIDGTPSVVVASTASEDQMLRPLTIPQGAALQLGDQGHTSCKIRDLDGDGIPDLAFSASTEDDDRALFLARGHGVDKSTPKLMLSAGPSDDDWDIFRKDDEVHLSFHRAGRNPQTGKEIKIASSVTLNVEDDESHESTVRVTVVSTPPEAAGISIISWDNAGDVVVLEKDKRGETDDLWLRKRPGRAAFDDGLGSSDVGGGLFAGSRQLIVEHGNWIAGYFAGGIVEGDEDGPALRQGDPKSIIGYLSTTGPFNPVESIHNDSGGLGSMTELVATPRGADNDGEARVLSLVTNEVGEATALRVIDLAVVDDAPTVVGGMEIELDFSKIESSSRKATKFKAGAELSKSVNIAAPDDSNDCDDGDTCPHPSDLLLAIELEGGEIVVGHKARGMSGDDDSIVFEAVHPHGFSFSTADDDDVDVHEALWTGNLGGAPVMALSNPLYDSDTTTGDNPLYENGRVNGVVIIQGVGEERETLVRGDSDIVFGDFQNLGHDQMVELTDGEDAGDDRCQPRYLAITDGNTRSLADAKKALEGGPRSVCFPPQVGAVSVHDIDGDHCQDLVFDTNQALLSRCDGTFEEDLVELGAWSAHVDRGDGWETGGQRGQDYNSSRSNKPTCIAHPGDLDGDDDDDDDDDHGHGQDVVELMSVLPFFDGLMRVP